MQEENQGQDETDQQGPPEGAVTERTVEETTRVETPTDDAVREEHRVTDEPSGTVVEETTTSTTEEQVGVPDGGGSTPDGGEPVGGGATDHGVVSPDTPSDTQGEGSSQQV